jgi:hypothetical protein
MIGSGSLIFDRAKPSLVCAARQLVTDLDLGQGSRMFQSGGGTLRPRTDSYDLITNFGANATR